MFSLGVPRLKFINLGFVCLFVEGFLFFPRVNLTLLIQLFTVQCKACEFYLGEYILQEGGISADVILKDVTPFWHLLAAALLSDRNGFCYG